MNEPDEILRLHRKLLSARVRTKDVELQDKFVNSVSVYLEHTQTTVLKALFSDMHMYLPTSVFRIILYPITVI